jgi:diguanylate cyclase (GGDEF)-like protein
MWLTSVTPLWRCICLGVWVFLLGTHSGARADEPGRLSPVVTLNSQIVGTLVGRQMQYLEDPAGKLTLEQVRAMSARFALCSSEGPNFSFTKSVYWFHVALENRNSSDVHWLVEAQYPLIDHFTFYAVRDGQLVDTREGGRPLPFAQRLIKHRNFIYPFEAYPGQSIDLYIRVQTSSSLQLPLAVWTPQAFLAKDHEEQLAFGLYYGVLGAMFIYNLMIFLSIKEISYFHYLHYLGGYTVFLMALNGLAYEYLWPDSPRWGAVGLPMLICFALIGMVNFSRTFLNLHSLMPVVNRWLRYFSYLLAMLSVCALVVDYAIMIRLAAVNALIASVAVFACGCYCLVKGERTARYFMLAWSALLAGVAAYVLKTFDVLPVNLLTEYGLQIGSALEALLLSFALAQRMTMLKEENLRIQAEATSQLEQRVAQRTQELGVAMQSLSQANAALQVMSLTDGLTGIKNRKHFDTQLSNEIKRSARGHLWLSLLLIDIDHFKKVNDQYGHLAGDACLREVANTIKSCLARPSDDVARYGGEEFAVILPHTDLEGAAFLAQKICQTVAALHFEFEGQHIPTTISIGCCAALPETQGVSQALIAAADAALYQAKRSGRNRVCVAPV